MSTLLKLKLKARLRDISLENYINLLSNFQSFLRHIYLLLSFFPYISSILLLSIVKIRLICLQASLNKANTAVFKTTVFVSNTSWNSLLPLGKECIHTVMGVPVGDFAAAAARENVRLCSTGPLFLHTLTHQRSTTVL